MASKWAHWARYAWESIHRFFAVLSIIRFSLLIPAVLILTLLVSDQMTDALVALADRQSVLQVAAFLVMTILAALVVWYIARTMLRFRFPAIAASDPEVYPQLKRQLPRLLALSVPAALLAKMVALRGVMADAAAATRIVMAMSAALVLIGLYVYLRRRLAAHPPLSFLAEPEDRESRNLADLAALPRLTRAVLAALVAANVAALGLALEAPLFLLGTPALLLLALALIAVIGSALVYMGNHYRVPVLTGVVLWTALWSVCNDNHQVRQVPQSHSHGLLSRADPLPVELLKPSPIGDQTIAEYFDAWWDDLAEHEPGGGPIPVVIVAADGGGIRAGYWTAGVLAALEDATSRDPTPFSRHVFAISGVSGGSLGAATYAAIVARRAESSAAPEPLTCVQEASAVLGRDFLSPTLANALFIDLLQRFIPVPVFDDRAMALEQSWESSWRAVHPGDGERFAQPFHQLWAARPHAVPLLFLNGTVVEGGERAIVDPLAADADGASPFADALRLGSLFGTELPLSTAVLLSARFTYVSPAGLLGIAQHGDVRWQRIVDGGYFDNSASVTAEELIRTLQREHRRRSLSDPLRRVQFIVLHISNGPQDPRATATQGDVSDANHVWLSETLSPVRALLHTRSAHASQAADFLAMSSAEKNVAFFEIGLFKGRTDLPLGWALSSEAQAAMDEQLKDCSGFGDLCAGKLFAKILASLRPL